MQNAKALSKTVFPFGKMVLTGPFWQFTMAIQRIEKTGDSHLRMRNLCFLFFISASNEPSAVLAVEKF